MDRDVLIANLLAAARELIPYTQPYVVEQLPAKFQFYRLDRETRARDRKPHYLGPFSAEEIVDHYWREARHPAWLSVTIVELAGDCCRILVDSEGRWTDTDERTTALARIRQNEHPPFSCAVTPPPPLREGLKR
ncbi:MAG: hypothetical protein ABFD69_13850 [Candidatus Sumerlaeia bacterium]